MDDGYEYGYESSPDDSQERRDDAGKRGISGRTKGIITLVLIALYLIVPTDVVPDAIVGLGQIDDAVVFATGVISILMRLRGSRK